MGKAEAMKLDILLGLKQKGYNLVDGDQPEIMTMSLGGGYTLICNVKKPTNDWKILFNDGVETSEYPANSVKVIYTYRKDSDKLIKEYEAGCKAIGIIETPAESKPIFPPVKREETSTQKKKKSSNVKSKTIDEPGMKLPIVYPSELKGSFMRFKQWTANNNVIPTGSEVVVLDEDEKNFRVSIARAHIAFDIPKNKAEVIQ